MAKLYVGALHACMHALDKSLKPGKQTLSIGPNLGNLRQHWMETALYHRTKS